MVDIDDNLCRITVSEHNPAIDNLLSTLNKSFGYFITPENPFSFPLSVEKNELRHQRFMKSIAALKLDYYQGYGNDDESWGREKSYLTICDDHNKMCELASQYGQNGLLQMAKHDIAKLFILEPLSYKLA